MYLHFFLSLHFQSLGLFNESISEFRYSLSLEPTSEPVLSVYSSVLCEIRKVEASMKYSRKLDETQVSLWCVCMCVCAECNTPPVPTGLTTPRRM